MTVEIPDRENEFFEGYTVDALREMLEQSYAIRKKLDIKTTSCEGCGRVKRKRWDDWKLYRELGAFQDKMKKWIERLDNGSFNTGSGGDWTHE